MFTLYTLFWWGCDSNFLRMLITFSILLWHNHLIAIFWSFIWQRLWYGLFLLRICPVLTIQVISCVHLFIVKCKPVSLSLSLSCAVIILCVCFKKSFFFTYSVSKLCPRLACLSVVNFFCLYVVLTWVLSKLNLFWEGISSCSGVC